MRSRASLIQFQWCHQYNSANEIIMRSEIVSVEKKKQQTNEQNETDTNNQTKW